MIKFIELFAGIGGFRYGLEACNIEPAHISKKSQQKERTSGGEWATDERQVLLRSGDKPSFSCVWANEWDKYAASIYRRHYGEIDQRDITTVDVSEIPGHDLLVGGFPCQAFSVAGKRLGFEDTRGTLFFEIARILKHHRPGHILLENVKGLLSHESGKTFYTILEVLSDLGYRVEWMVLNSKHFGVPQNRERVFIIGHLRGGCRGEIFPISEDGKATLIELTETGSTQGYRVYDTSGIAQTLASQAGGLGAKTGLYAMRGRDEGQQLELRDNETNSLTSVGKDNLWLENSRIRRLTPVECERLQGFPDHYTKWGIVDGRKGPLEISDTQRYKACGNAVTTSVIQAIGTELMKHIKENE